MTGRRSGSVALFPVGFVCSGGSLSVCLSPLGARSVCLSPLGARSVCLSLLHGQAIFTESVPGEGVPQFWVGHVVRYSAMVCPSVEGQKASQCIGGLFPMCQIVFLLFSYHLVLPDVFVVVCYTMLGLSSGFDYREWLVSG